jgi:hypothetical protein
VSVELLEGFLELLVGFDKEEDKEKEGLECGDSGCVDE